MHARHVSKTAPAAEPQVGGTQKTELEAAVATVREMMPWRKSLYIEVRRLTGETAMLRGNRGIIKSNEDPDNNRLRDRNWAANMRRRDAGSAERLVREGELLWAAMARFKDAHAILMKHAVPEKLDDRDIGALLVTAISLPLTEDDPHLVARLYDEALLALVKVEFMMTPFDDLLKWAKEELKGKELAVVELVCESKGRLALEQLAKNTRINWAYPCDGTYNNIQGKVNGKLLRNNKSQRKTRLPYSLKRVESCAVIERFDV